MSHTKFFLTTMCFIVGTALFTYATTRTMTTKDVLEKAQINVRAPR